MHHWRLFIPVPRHDRLGCVNRFASRRPATSVRLCASDTIAWTTKSSHNFVSLARPRIRTRCGDRRRARHRRLLDSSARAVTNIVLHLYRPLHRPRASAHELIVQTILMWSIKICRLVWKSRDRNNVVDEVSCVWSVSILLKWLAENANRTWMTGCKYYYYSYYNR